MVLGRLTRGALNLGRRVLRQIGRNRDPDAEHPPGWTNQVDMDTRFQRFRELEQDFRDRVRDLNRRAVSGEITVPEWQALYGVEIRTYQVTSRVVGAGGFGSLTDDDLRDMERITRDELQYLDRFARGLDPDNLNEQMMNIRGQMYSGAGRESFERGAASSQGVPRLPFYPRQGTDCRGNCQCHWEIKPLEGDGNFDCFWERSPVDSCEVCINREIVCNPLEIRGGTYQTPSGRRLWAKSGTLESLWKLLTQVDPTMKDVPQIARDYFVQDDGTIVIMG